MADKSNKSRKTLGDSAKRGKEVIASEDTTDEDSNPAYGVDIDYDLYDLTTLFCDYYSYHNDSQIMALDDISVTADNKIQHSVKTYSRFSALRRIEASRLGARPFLSGQGVAAHRPNVSFGYLSTLFKYIVLPYKSVFTDSSWVRVAVDKGLYDRTTKTDAELEAIRVVEKNTPYLFNNKEVGDDLGDAFSDVLRTSRKTTCIADVSPRRVPQDGIISYVHSDLDWYPEVVTALDLVTEPQAHWDACGWTSFFVIKKMTAKEVVDKIKNPGLFWNADALRWALESSHQGKSVLADHRRGFSSGKDDPDTKAMMGENYMVKSFYSDKAERDQHLNKYYGNILVVEAYVIQSDGRVHKHIFFPSTEFKEIPKEQKKARKKYLEKTYPEESRDRDDTLEFLRSADVLYSRKTTFTSLDEAITVIPIDRSEPTIERQRCYGHELFALNDIVMRLDSSIINLAVMMGVPFTKSNSTSTVQKIEEIQVNLNGDTVDLGDKEFVEVPFKSDLQSMLAVRSVLLQHMASLCFLGGLDGDEVKSNGRGGQLANLRLIRDGRVHKHSVEHFAAGHTDLFRKVLKAILVAVKSSTIEDPLILHKFFNTFTKVKGHEEELLKFEKSDILEDTRLPYWIDVSTIRNGGSHFGAAEVAIFSEVRNLFGDVLTQEQSANLSRAGIKSILGTQDATDILGDPRDEIVTSQDQLYMAFLEKGAIKSSVSGTELDFDPVPIRAAKDDHVAHLSQVHLPHAQKILDKIESAQVTPDKLDTLTVEDLETRTNLILELGANALHISQHADQLERFGRRRADINKLKEQTNFILQAIEGLMNSLQMHLRSLQMKRDETRMRLENISPENEAEKMKIELELRKLASEDRKTDAQLAIANSMQQIKKEEVISNRVNKAMDREFQRDKAQMDAMVKLEDIQTKRDVALMSNKVSGEA